MFVSAHGLKCLLGVFITLSDLQHDSYFMSHLAQLREGRAGWQSASPLVSGGEEGGHRTSPQDLKQDILASETEHGRGEEQEGPLN